MRKHNDSFNAAIALALFLLGLVATVQASYTTATDVEVTASSYVATRNTIQFELAFAPAREPRQSSGLC